MRKAALQRFLRASMALGLLACPMLAATSQAAVIAYEDFESYVAGSALAGQSGGTGWTGAWTAPAQATVQATSLGGPGLLVNGGAQAMQLQLSANNPGFTDIGSAFARNFAATSDTLYVSYLIRVESFEDSDFVSIANSDGAAGNTLNSVSTGVRNNAGNPIFARVGTSNDVTVNVTTGAGSTVPDVTDFHVVTKYSKVGGSVDFNQTDVFVNPTGIFEPTPSATATLTNAATLATMNLTQLSQLNGRIRANETNDIVLLDSFRVATTYHEAVGGLILDAAADSHIQSPPQAGSTNFGLSPLLQVKNAASADGGFDRKAYMRFETPTGDAFGSVSNGELVLTIDTTNNPGAALPGTAWTFQLFGLKDDAAGQNWVEGNGGNDNNPAGEITWNNAPANDTSSGSGVNLLDVFGGEALATFEIIGRGVNGAQIVLDDPRIAAFLRSDTDGMVTFILSRLTLETSTSTNSVVHQFRSSESTAGGGPTLRAYGYYAVPEPSVAILGLMGMAGLGVRRRRAQM